MIVQFDKTRKHCPWVSIVGASAMFGGIGRLESASTEPGISEKWPCLSPS